MLHSAFIPIRGQKRALFICAVLSLITCPWGFGAMITWDGGGSNVDWSASENWGGDAAPSEGDDLIFIGPNRLTNNIVGTGPRSFNSLSFSNVSGQFLIGGNEITNGAGGINVYAHAFDGVQMTNRIIRLSANQTWNFVSNFYYNGTLTTNDIGSHTLTINAHVGSSNRLTGTVVGSGTLILEGGGRLVLGGLQAGSNEISNVIVKDGTLALSRQNNNKAIAGATLTIGDGIGGAETAIVVPRAGEQVATNTHTFIKSDGLLDLGGLSHLAGEITMEGGVIRQNGNTLRLKLFGPVNINASSETALFDSLQASSRDAMMILSNHTVFTVADGAAADDFKINMVFENGTPFDITKAGAGTMVLANTNRFDNVVFVGAGTIVATTNNALGTATGGTIISNGATVAFRNNVNYTTAESITNFGSGVNNYGGIFNQSGNNTFAGNVILGSDSTFGTSNGTLNLSGTVEGGGFGLRITNAASTTLTFGGTIASGSGPITHVGSGTMEITGINSSAAAITNASGSLSFNGASALGTNSTVSVTGGTLLFNTHMTNATTDFRLSGGTMEVVDSKVSVGKLTMTADSTIDLRNGGSTGVLRFTSATNSTGTAVLTIFGWTGTEAGGTGDLIFFTNSSEVTSTFLSNVTFFGGIQGNAQILGTGELVPITPEPNTLLSGIFMLLTFLGRRGMSLFRFLMK
jgi:hypothetical protein